MPNPSVFWTDVEVIVAVYFLSRGVTEAAISEMLQARGYHRSISSVRCKTMAIARQNKELQKSRDEWDIRAGDFWLDSRTLPHGVVSHVIGPIEEDITIMEEHGLSEAVLENLSRITSFRSELNPQLAAVDHAIRSMSVIHKYGKLVYEMENPAKHPYYHHFRVLCVSTERIAPFGRLISIIFNYRVSENKTRSAFDTSIFLYFLSSSSIGASIPRLPLFSFVDKVLFPLAAVKMVSNKDVGFA